MKTLNYIPGTQLTAQDQRHVLASFVHRFTREHRPNWAARADCKNCPVQFESDADWLAHSRFAVRKDGRIDQRVSACESSPTWPDNPELRKGAA